MGFLNVIIKEGLYDKKFVEKWTNAPFLVSDETGKLLHESDLVKGGSPDNYIIWNTAKEAPEIWDSDRVEYRSPRVKPALEGSYEIDLANRKRGSCKTVWTLFCEEVNKYPLDRVAEITWAPAEKISEAARFYAKSNLLPSTGAFQSI